MVKWILSFLMIAQASEGAVVTLTQKTVAEKALQDSYLAAEVNLSAQTARYTRSLLLIPFDYNFKVESGLKRDKFENFSGSVNTPDRQDSYVTTASLTKLFSTGTTVGLSYTRNSIDSVYPASATVTSNSQTQDIVMLSIEQNLLKNFFGNANRATLRAAEALYKASTIGRADDLQELVLNSIRLFWKAYVAQETFQEALNSRERYQKLVQSVKKKSSYGYAAPGEFAQVQAELESKEQAVKRESVTYLSAIDELTTLLKYPPGTEYKFQVSKEVPPVPKFEPVNFEETRAVRAARLRAEAANELYKAASANSYPDFSLVGRLGSAGLENNASDAYSEMNSGTHPQSYIGVKVQYSFGSDALNEEKLNKKILKDLEEARLQRQLAELGDSGSLIQRNLQSAYAIVVSTRTQKDLREKAALELNRTYTQGRTDISILIESLNKFYTAKIDYSRAVGDYQIALNEWAALRDELIPEEAAKKD